MGSEMSGSYTIKWVVWITALEGLNHGRVPSVSDRL
jgi:hypothetical protein